MAEHPDEAQRDDASDDESLEGPALADVPGYLVNLHGHDLFYLKAGTGPPLVLLHGVLCSGNSWHELVDDLAQDFTVIAPDLFGHGQSAKHQGDYSLGAHAGALRDLIDHLGIGSTTLVGHSLGGGIAMQFSYLFPGRVERLVLVDSGGLGRELSFMLKAPAIPGAELVLPVLASSFVRNNGSALGRGLRRLGLGSPDVAEAWAGFTTLGNADARRAFLSTIRSVVDPGGQTVDGRDRLYLMADIPLLIVWGGRDRLIPVRHAHETHAAISGSRLEVFEKAGHFPHLADPARFAALVRDFVSTPREQQADVG